LTAGSVQQDSWRDRLAAELDHDTVPFVANEEARALDDAVEEWASAVGIFPMRDDVHAARFGLFALLTHPTAQNLDRVLLAGKHIATLEACDDYYCDVETLGATPLRVAPRLWRALTMVDPPNTLRRFEAALAEEFAADPILRALALTRAELAVHATPAQLGRYVHATVSMFMGMASEAMWRHAAYEPPVWEYLASRQTNSAKPCLSIIDIIGGYEVPSDEYYDPNVIKAIDLANAQILLVNDLYSTSKERTSIAGGEDIVGVVARERSCSRYEAVRETIAIHNEITADYRSVLAGIRHRASPALRRFTDDLTSWVNGNLRWHLESGRHRD
jgi:hypothetical protein